jgi:hypothetical protein
LRELRIGLGLAHFVAAAALLGPNLTFKGVALSIYRKNKKISDCEKIFRRYPKINIPYIRSVPFGARRSVWLDPLLLDYV